MFSNTILFKQELQLNSNYLNLSANAGDVRWCNKQKKFFERYTNEQIFPTQICVRYLNEQSANEYVYQRKNEASMRKNSQQTEQQLENPGFGHQLKSINTLLQLTWFQVIPLCCFER